MPLLEALGVAVRVAGRSLLRDVSLAVEAGEVVALIGPNGAGKSTLLRVLAGELNPSEGATVFDGRDLAAWRSPELARRRAVVTQHADRDCQLTARQIIELGRLPWGRRSQDAAGAGAVQAAMAATAVAPLANRAFATLSGGERQRVHLARALVQIAGPGGYRGRLLLLDEPTAHMDIAAQLFSLDLVSRLAEQGLAVVIALHDLAAAAVADRICVLRDGRAVIFAPPDVALTPTVIHHAFDVHAQKLQATNGAAAFVCRLSDSGP